MRLKRNIHPWLLVLVLLVLLLVVIVGIDCVGLVMVVGVATD